jgi:hypothetical protein
MIRQKIIRRYGVKRHKREDSVGPAQKNHVSTLRPYLLRPLHLLPTHHPAPTQPTKSYTSETRSLTHLHQPYHLHVHDPDPTDSERTGTTRPDVQDEGGRVSAVPEGFQYPGESTVVCTGPERFVMAD